MRVFVSAGEPSGDERAGELVRELVALRPDWEFLGMGGPEMKRAGVELVAGLPRFSVVGFQEALGAIQELRKGLREVLAAASSCDLVIHVDYPGFHLYTASKLPFRIPKVYYIPPQTWAWGQARVGLLSRYYSLLLCILPFEEDYFRSFGLNALFVGHPVLDKLRNLQPLETTGDPIIGILPGSREHEIRRMLPVFLEVKRLLHPEHPGARFLLSLTRDSDFAQLPQDDDSLQIVRGQGARVLASSNAALVSSGTATLEAAVLGTPSVVAYALAGTSYWLARTVARVRYASLPNIILGQELFPEHIQRLSPRSMARDLSRLLAHAGELEPLLQRVRSSLGGSGAAARAAKAIVDMMGG